MGAYYQAALKQSDSWTMYDTEGNGIKLMEHSYIDNAYVNGVMAELLNKPTPIVWVCDYTESNNPSVITWSSCNEVKCTKTLYDPYFVVNTTTQEYINIAQLKVLHAFKYKNEWAIHPVPILCNSEPHSMGGGDYHPEDSRRGIWKGDMLQVVLEEPKGLKNITEDCLFEL